MARGRCPDLGRDGVTSGFTARTHTSNRRSFRAYRSRRQLTVLAGRSGISVACIRGRSNAVRTEGMTRGGEYMAKKLLAAVMALSFLTVMFACSADANRRCPRGQEDVGDVCVPKEYSPDSGCG